MSAAACLRVSWHRMLVVVEPDHLAEGGQVGVSNDLSVAGASQRLRLRHYLENRSCPYLG
jgi:hypothetical protein